MKRNTKRVLQSTHEVYKGCLKTQKKKKKMGEGQQKVAPPVLQLFGDASFELRKGNQLSSKKTGSEERLWG